MHPVTHIILKFGGATQLAEALGVARSTVYRWTYSGRSGIPAKARYPVMAAARRAGITITKLEIGAACGQ